MAWLLVLSGALALSGCAHYYLPSGRLDTPEVRGRAGKGRILPVILQHGTDLTINYALGAEIGVSDRMEIDARVQPDAPLVLRLKRQLSGAAEDEASRGFATAISGGAGLLLGRSDGQNTSYFLVDAAFIAGYRIDPRHLVTISPFFSYGSLSGTTILDASGAARSSTSADQYGAALGYQYTLEGLLLRAELSYALGSRTGADLGGLGGAACAGLRF